MIESHDAVAGIRLAVRSSCGVRSEMQDYSTQHFCALPSTYSYAIDPQQKNRECRPTGVILSFVLHSSILFPSVGHVRF